MQEPSPYQMSLLLNIEMNQRSPPKVRVATRFRFRFKWQQLGHSFYRMQNVMLQHIRGFTTL